METFQTLICLLLIVVSGFMSGSEIALFSLSKYQLKSMKDRFRVSHKRIRKLLADPSGLLVTVLIGNEVLNVAISTLMASALSQNVSENPGFFERFLRTHVPDWAYDTILSTLITAPILLLLCEITPKVLGTRANTLFAPLASGPLMLFYQMMRPFRWVVQAIQTAVRHLVPRRRSQGELLADANEPKLKEEDFLVMVEEAHKEGNVQSTELELIRNVFEFDDTPVSEVYTPLSRVFSFQVNTTLAQALTAMKEESRSQKFSRVPVYGKNRADVVGVLYSKDLLVAKLEKDDPATPISQYMWKPLTVSAATRLHNLFRRMRTQRTHMAVVVNERGTALGVVTMNDVLDQFIAEIFEHEETG